MDFPLYQEVALAKDLPEENLRTGDVGTVVERHAVAGAETGYNVEFFNTSENTVAVVTVPGSALRAPTRADRLAVRAVDGATTIKRT